MLLCEFIKGVIQSYQVNVHFGLGVIEEFLALATTASFECLFLTVILDENSSHCFRSSSKEMAATGPMLGLVDVYQSHVRLMD